MGAGPNDASTGMSGLPGPGYVCKICQVPGHWIRDCPQKKQQEASDGWPNTFTLSEATAHKNKRTATVKIMFSTYFYF